jgi:glycosyltransferase involved in cell wall biosynthesis
MPSPRYDVAIWSPGAASLYLDRGPATGGAELQTVLLARSLTSLGLRICQIVVATPELPTSVGGTDLIQVERPGGGAIPTLTRFREALDRADARVYVQRAAGLATGVVGIYARARRRAFVYSTASSRDLSGGLPLAWQERVALELGLRCANTVVVQTREQAVAAPRRFRTVQIPSFCEQSDGAAGAGADDRDTFVWVGRAAAYKNPLPFIRLAREVPAARFVMAGIDPDVTPPEILVAAGQASNLELVPPLPREELLPLYDRAVAVVNTSDFEGFPNTLLEGWARGALALTQGIDPDGVISRHGLGVVAAGSDDELAGAARAMWSDRGQVEEARANAVMYVREHHAADVVGRQWAEILCRLMR